MSFRVEIPVVIPQTLSRIPGQALGMGAEGDPGQGLTNIAFMDYGLGVLLLLEGHLPHTRARRLQLLSNILHTRFDSKKTTPENILKFEDSIEEYGKASGDVVQDDLRVSVVLGNTEGPLRQAFS